MYAITGITGQVGGAMARALLFADKNVRAVVRNIEKGRSWAAKGCEIIVADMEDAAALATAFKGTDGAFILPPSEFDPLPGYPIALRVIVTVKHAMQRGRPKKILHLTALSPES